MRRLICSILIVALYLCGQSTIPVLRGNGGSSLTQLGKLASANMNVTTDQTVTMTIPGGATKYDIDYVKITNCSANVGTGMAAGTIYTAASKGGSALYTAATTYAALSTTTALFKTTVSLSATLTGNVFFSLTTANGSAGTCDIYVFGTPLQ